MGKIAQSIFRYVDSDAIEVEIQFLKKMKISTDPSQVKWDWLATEDKEIVDAKLCFEGQCTPNITNSSRTKSAITCVLEAEIMPKFHEIV